ncbi:MAG TPA: amino acid adenylation domain-containing protein, partial [Thermoanaerobaculia bacterium]|nr:amino acid adenylation domain-containing protein [Thermoanaerobaculia bacterium]
WWAQSEYRLQADDRVLQKTPFGFDVSVWEFFLPLLAGARLVMARPGGHQDPSYLTEVIAREGITTMHFVPSMIPAFLTTANAENCASLRRILCSGEALPHSAIVDLAKAIPHVEVHNLYGPTEAAVDVTAWPCKAGQYGQIVPIGRPIANTQMYLLDSRGEPVPVGVEGELFIGGVQVARGYLNRPELTAERFVRNPFAEGRLYKTGDLGRWLPDGNIEYLGRNDFQVKIRGFRIELGEIEARLSQCAGVREAVVVAREDVPGDKRLVAYLVGEEGMVPDAAELRAELLPQLPEYMVPSAFVVLQALPLSSNGKLDRKALPAPETTALIAREYEAPQGGIEEKLASMWRELLRIERVGRNDDFFELGGHSLLAVQLISRLRTAFDAEVPLRALFAASSLRAQAEVVRKAGASAMERIVRADRSQPLPLSLAQQRLWFLHELDRSASVAYHMPAAMRLRGRLDVDALQATLDRVVARHEVLRTSFVAVDGVPYQQIAAEDCGFALTRHDLRGLPAGEREALVAALTAEEAREPFDMSVGPMVRGRLLALEDDEHVLLITQHHIVSDGWSIDVMTREVAALYAAFSRGEEDPLPALEIQYADYAQWQRSWLQGEELARQFDFWKEHLAGAPALLELPTDHPRPVRQSYAGASVPLVLSPELTAGLRELSQRHGVTMFMTMLSAWGVLLSRLSGQTDVVIGTPVANRQRREVESLIGFFINTLALRLRVDERPSVEALLAQVKETMLAAFAHQELPFEQVVEALQPQRSQSHSPIAQVTFTWNNIARGSDDGESEARAASDLMLVPAEQPQETTQVDLQLLLSDAGTAVGGSLVFATSLFDRGTIERWAAYYVRVLEAMVADASMTVDALPLLAEAEREQLLHAFNATDVSYPAGASIPQLFEELAAAQPDAIAVVHDDESLTYAELNVRANRLAHYLIGLGVQPDDRVAICTERNADLIVGLLGILKAGGAYLPLDPSHPRERLAAMLDDAAPVALLIHSDVEELLPETEVPVLRLDIDVPVLARRLSAENPVVPGLQARNLAYVIYTSGSTGTPKGVMVEQRDVVALVRARDYVALGAQSVVAQASNPAFDAATFEIWGALLNGGRLVLIDKETLIDPLLLQKRLVAEQVDTLFVTTALFNRIARNHPSAIDTLGTLLFGGEKVAPEMVAAVLRNGFRGRLLHVYGPTENTTFSTWYHVTEAPAPDAPTVPIGRGLAGARLYVLDAQRRPVPVGVAGEIYIGGAGVARGYLNRPELTAERFLDDPFRADAEGRMYKTGDLGRWLPDGNIEFLDRNDFQVKIRGFRIELGEIEARLGQCDGVREAAVLARQDEPGDKRLVAYVVPAEGAALSVADLRAALLLQLPEYMVPSAFVQLDALPLNANGKLDRKALPAPEAAALGAAEYEAPQGEIEEALAKLWQELLRVERVGRHDNFFELGGHSLLAVQLISHIRAALNVELPLRELFATSSLVALAEVVRAAGASSLSRIEIADRNQPLPLSLAQQRLWFLDQLDQSASAAYHMPAALRLLGTLNADALQATLDRLVARHEVLRTSFAAIDGVPFQQIASPDAGFALKRVDLRSLSAADRESAVARLTAEEARAPFDLSAGPLIRGQLLILGDREHVLLVTQHHIISDGWSLNVLIGEVAALYTAFSRGEADPLPPLEIQYADYAQWQRSWLQGEELARQFGFWKEHLSGAPALLELPTDRPRPAVQSYAGDILPFGIRPELTSGLRELSQRHGVTLYMTLLSAWGVLLSRLSGQHDVVIGTPVANRQRREVENLIGFFVNTLALRLRVEDRPSVEALLAQVKETTLAAFAHQELPFEQVVEALQPQRSQSYSPIAQVTFTWNNLEGSEGSGASQDLPDLQLAPVAREHDTTQVDLQLLLDDAGEVLTGSWVFSTALFDRATIERWAAAYVRVLEAMVVDASATVDALPLLSGAERDSLLVGFNDTASAYPGDALIHQLFEQQVVANPDAVAVVYEGDSLTYSELNERANQLAHYLISLGVQADDRVAICTERNADLIVGLLGILKAGGAYLPLDPSYPQERLAWMLEDATPVAMLVHSDLAELLPETDVPVLRLDVDVPILTRRLPVENPAASGLHARSLAYVIYTSGSTGLPKGVMVEHRNVNRLVINNPYFTATAADCFAHCANPAFDAATWEIWGALHNGARLLVVPPSVVMEPSRLNATLSTNNVTALWLTVGLFNQYVDSLPDAFANLQYLLVGGDALDPRTIRQLLASEQRPAHVVNGYGPTETTTFAITHDITEVADDARSIPLGKPIANTQIYILDANRQPVPVGVAGEIYIGGDGVARGYLNRAELTAERFLANPFAEGTMYKTGDRGRWLADGTIEFLGRNDFQVKLRGFRIELGEIEARLSECAGVRDAIVIAREDVPGDKRLVAYLIGDSSIGDLRETLSRRLPDYMVPSAFVQLDAFPLTANGKVDRRALPAPEATALNVREYEAPQGEIEETLATLWRELLRVERVGRKDNFFELGGHSLLAVQLISHVRAALHVELPLRDLFATSSLSALADAVRAAGASTLDRIEVADRNQPLPLSLAQQRLWFLDQLDGAEAYHIPTSLRLIGALDVEALQAALDRLVARHEVLRTSFAAIDGIPYQRIAPETAGFALKREDLRGFGIDERRAHVERITAHEARERFDLANGPLVRGSLLRVTGEEHVLLVTQHHIVSDGWSMNILVREVAALYAAFTRGEADPLPALPLQYADYAQWQRNWLQGEELARQLDFWKGHLSGAPALLELPTDRPRPAVQSYAGDTVPFTLSAELTGALRAFSQRHGATMFMTLLSAWGVLLARLSGQADVVVGTPVANRQRREVEDLIGFFVNTLALRLRFDEQPTVASLLAQAKDATLAAFTHQELPFEQVVEAVQPQRSLSHGPLFQTMLALNNTDLSSNEELELPGLRLAPAASSITTSQHDLSIHLTDAGDTVSGFLVYTAALFDRETVERWAGYFARVLEAMVADASAAVDALPLLPDAERRQVLYGFNDTAASFPDDTLIHELFEQQAARTPDAVAVVFENDSLTYAELNASANQLAHALIGLGVEPDDRVAVRAERSLEMVIALLGTLKAGGAYVPLDPSYPADRLQYMLDDAQPKA